jgi:hypothetical protein
MGKDVEGNGCGIIEVLSWNLSGGAEKNYENTLWVADGPAKIRTE